MMEGVAGGTRTHDHGIKTMYSNRQSIRISRQAGEGEGRDTVVRESNPPIDADPQTRWRPGVLRPGSRPVLCQHGLGHSGGTEVRREREM